MSHVISETLNIGRRVPSGTNSPPVEVSTKWLLVYLMKVNPEMHRAH